MMRALRRTLTPLALMLLAVAAPARADEVSDLIDRYVAWRGGAAYERLTSVHLTAAMQGGGETGEAEAWRDRSGRSRDDYELGLLKGASAVADDAWVANNGVVEDMPAESEEDARRRTALEFVQTFREGRPRLLEPEARDGRRWSVVRLDAPGPDTYDALIDPATGELWGFRIVENRRQRFLRLSDWRPVSGVRTAFLRVESTDNPAETVRLTVHKATLNEALPAALFTRPQSRRIASFLDGASGTGPLAFNFYRGARIYIPATVNGRPVEVLLDSGAEMTVIDKTFAESLGLATRGQAVAVGTGGQTDASFAGGVKIRIGAMALDDLNVAVLDLADVAKRVGAPLPVILGADVFKQLIVDVDFESRQIAFHEPATFRPPAEALAVPVKASSEGVRTVTVSIEGGPPTTVDFDLGNGGAFIVSPAYWEPRRMLEGRPSSRTLGGAVGGARETMLATLRTLDFGGVTFRDVPATFSLPGPTATDGDRAQGNIGLQVLSRFRLMTDYPNDRLYLLPHADAASRPFPRNRTGLRTTLEGDHLKVLYVSPGSPAETAGFKSGEAISAIDGQAVTPAFNDGPRAQWDSGEAGRTVRLTLGDGSVRTLTLKDYF